MLIGATSEMGPLDFLLKHNATVVGIARPSGRPPPPPPPPAISCSPTISRSPALAFAVLCPCCHCCRHARRRWRFCSSFAAAPCAHSYAPPYATWPGKWKGLLKKAATLPGEFHYPMEGGTEGADAMSQVPSPRLSLPQPRSEALKTEP